MTRLTADRLDELHRGVLMLVAEHGYEKVTMDRIAEVTRSSKATLYRQWGSKLDLVVDALGSSASIDEEPPDTGTLGTDLHELVDRGLRNRAQMSYQNDLIAALMHAVKASPELGAALREQILASIRSTLGSVLDRATDRGEVDADWTGREHLVTAFIAPFVLHDLVSGTEPDADFLHSWVDIVLLPALTVR
ncbi:transcriptional regulator, TetR family [Aeromicrobium marinum DSM 15272]|uniref:Transcriptional regulator, TetR family n=1 Tax=Aeromicrobium marinum DSM 15272 TaxID=585531 RepID=E2SF81_9ACTN|nr:TetR/AcrR family transcriptional regulator [Aeromicrobium marinum]EFQ82166.1 transcriptional regulator, TetR family [Aeromicrobium marinum DSM 15272]